MTDDWTFDAIGTRWCISAPSPLPEALRAEVSRVVDDYDRGFSRFRDDSLVTRHARQGGTVAYPDAAAPLLDLYERVGALTEGRVSPLVGRSLERLGYDADYTLVASGGPLPAPVGALTVRGRDVTLTAPALIDVGAAGKGQLVDLVAERLRAAGVAGATVEAGGDLRHDGAGLAVALEDPRDATLAVGVADLAPGRRAIAGSAGNRRRWDGGRHHILDATTGRPTDDVLATWAVASDAMTADLLATALFFVPGERLRTSFDLDWVRVLPDGCIEASTTWPGEVFA